MSRRERKLLRRKGVKYTEREQITLHTEESVEEKKQRHPLLAFYEDKYKQLLIIPFAMLLIAFISLGVQYAQTGDFIDRGISLRGGVTVTVPTDGSFDTDDMERFLSSQFPEGDIEVRALTRAGRNVGFIVDAAGAETDSLVTAIEEKIGSLQGKEYSVEEIGSSLGASFFKESLRAILIAFIFMGIVVFFYFRIPIPSLAVILAAFSDMVVTLAIINFMGIKLSTAGIAAFLMLIGYSVDTDVLLSTRVLKRSSGSIFDRVIGAAKTGLTMNISTLAALTVGGLMLSQSEVLKQIMLILVIGLLVDIINTWIQNAGILRWYLEKYPVKFKEE